jgi:deoxyribose-phosphate aldolase
MEFKHYNETSESLRQRIDEIMQPPLLENEMNQIYRQIFGFLDLTSLEGSDNRDRIDSLCDLALDYKHKAPGLPVAAVCLYLPFVKQAKRRLENSGIAVATVACGFPSGQLPLDLKLNEVRYALDQGADEIDMVISRGKMLGGEFNEVFEEIHAVKAICGKSHLKVILETGELRHPDLIRKASELALLAGADFLKTSTGKISPAATPEAAIIMLDTIAEYHQKTNRKVGFKPAGGIAEPADALIYFRLVRALAGESWLNPGLFRIGASRLAVNLNKVLSE